MTDKSIDDLIFLAESWNEHPLVSRYDHSELRYDKSQRAYIEERVIARVNINTGSRQVNQIP